VEVAEVEINKEIESFLYKNIKNIKMIVILLCGIPGSGKSTLCSNLLQEWDRRNQQLSENISISYHISFDDIQDKYFIDKLNENSFQDIRKKGLDELKCILSNNINNNNDIIIIDDIMYLHSMRREVYVLARDFSSKLLVVWVKLDFNIALERNNNRIKEKIVNEKALLNIYNNFEIPSSNNICDRNFCIIDSSIKQRYFYIYLFI
jgi:tRNA uridine 5-carbamoylmethylation protein Kti12